MIFINEKNNNPEGCLCLVDYHPYRHGTNPAFDQQSGEILDLKDCKDSAIDKFFLLLDGLLAKGFPIAVVPSHDPKKIDSGIRFLAKKLAANGRIDATSCLERHIKVDKKAVGGTRSLDVDLKSIRVINNHLIRAREVMLLDDVRTSGGSLTACSQLLQEAGARIVKQVALAQTIN